MADTTNSEVKNGDGHVSLSEVFHQLEPESQKFIISYDLLTDEDSWSLCSSEDDDWDLPVGLQKQNLRFKNY